MLVIDGMNLDNYIIENKYSVNDAPEFGNSEYRDGWWKKHRDIVRHVIKGSVVLAFSTATEYNDFVRHINENIGVESDHSVTLYVNNLNTTKTISAYVTFATQTAIATHAYGMRPAFFSLTMAIEER